MVARRAFLFAASVIFSTSVVAACTCANYTPVQKTMEQYAKETIFTARVVQSLGQVYNNNGERSSSRVVTLVRHRYWGFPSYWPSLVILDGNGLCGTAFLEGQEYLVSAYPSTRYGVFVFGACSRTLPLKTSPVDLRTLDGSLCAGPGGTLIGHVYYSSENQPQASLVRNIVLTFRDSYGKVYTTQSDNEGIYELRHLPPGPYTLDSRIGPSRYAQGGGDVSSGVCRESSIRLHPYVVAGRLIPDTYWNWNTHLTLVGTDWQSRGLMEAIIASDGGFYFESVPQGEYFLMARVDLVGRFNHGAEVYYPGVSSRENAVKVRVSNQTRSQSLDFNPDGLPLDSIPIFVESPDVLHPIEVQIRVLDSWRRLAHQFGSLTG